MSSSAFKRKLSGSTDGMGILVAATGSPGTLIHTAIASTTVGTFDEVWLWAYNSDSANRTLTIEFGDATVPTHNIKVSIPYQQGEILVVPGFILQNGATVRAFASVINVVAVSGFVNYIADL
jgi:hypothetical protein